MLTRTRNKNTEDYKNYGGRGIKVCKEWLLFSNFWADMKTGYKDGLTIERVNNSKGYFKENCIWVNMKQQARNRRNNNLIIFKGEKHTLAEWAEIKKMSHGKLSARLHKLNWSIEKALTELGDKRKK